MNGLLKRRSSQPGSKKWPEAVGELLGRAGNQLVGSGLLLGLRGVISLRGRLVIFTTSSLLVIPATHSANRVRPRVR